MTTLLRLVSASIKPLFLSALLSVVLASPVTAANISCFGDSITRGYGSDTGGYPPKLSDLLNGNSRPAAIANFGIDGETTYEGANRFDEVLASFPANLILIQEGTNDIIIGVSSFTTGYNLQTMITKAKTAKVTPLIATLPAVDRNGGLSLVPNEWNPMIKNLASTNKIAVVDIYAATLPTWSANFSDGIHPNDAGYQIIANTWYATLSGMISSSGDIRSGGGGSDSGCFIATAAFGSPLERHVVLLKEFRDAVLLPTKLGKKFVSAYYRLSPPVADFISRHDQLKPLVRVALYPLIGLAALLLTLSPATLALIAAGGSAAAFLAVRAIKHRKAEATQSA